MLRNAKTLEGYALRARDGDIGHIKDFYFDDQRWYIRYFVVDTGSWLTGRRVLISPEAVNGQLFADRVIPIGLTRDQVRDSPGIDAAKPVSRQHEMELRNFYGWPPYWGLVYPETAMAPANPRVAPLDPPSQRYDRRIERKGADVGEDSPGDPHLRSISEVIAYRIEAEDGEIGHVDDFLIDDDAWLIRYLVIDTRNWWPGKKVIIAPDWIRDVSWAESKVFVGLARATIKSSPEYDPSQPVAPEYFGQLHDYYGRARHPDWDPDHKSAESRRNFQR